jgi:dolichol-phosphate mannosyltransferase
MKKYLLVIFCYNEKGKVDKVVKRFNDYALYDVLIIDDGSTDGFEDDLKDVNLKFTILKNETNRGAGYSVRKVLYYAKERGYAAVLLVAGNNKDSPEDVDKLVKAIDEGNDYVQGSRYLQGGSFGNMPFYRLIATKHIHPFLFLLATGRRMSETSNGFRAIRLSVIDDERIDLNQDWLDRYELETYLLYKVIKFGYKIKEVPVTKIYPPKRIGYSKVKPITGWWSILRPLLFLSLGLKK